MWLYFEKRLKSFKKPFIIITPADKCKSINIFYTSDYINKLDETFTHDKFKKLRYDPVNVDLKKYRRSINKIKPHLSTSDELKIMPVKSLKMAYGLPKNHKPDIPFLL